MILHGFTVQFIIKKIKVIHFFVQNAKKVYITTEKIPTQGMKIW